MGEPAGEKPPILYEFGPPLVRRAAGPLVDAHLHVGTVEATRGLVEAARAHGVTRAVGICRLPFIEPARQAFGDFFEFAVGLTYEHKDDPAHLLADNRAILVEAHGRGVRLVKFWFKPEFTATSGLTLADARMRPILDLIADLGMGAIVHIADPDRWFETRYADRAKFGDKQSHYAQLEHVLREYPTVVVQGAHLGGDPEHLDHLEQLLADYPNLCLDVSATKWMVRELSRQAEAARAFFIGHADRLLFGTDLVPQRDPHPRHYASRYWTLQALLEGAARRPSPIRDPDADGPVEIVGLDLPADVLERLYHLNAGRWLGLAARP
jgi:hypothetical protein